MESLPIGEVARRTGLTSATLRYYEDEGLIASIPRESFAATRRFDPAVLDALAVIQALRTAGFGIADVRVLLGAKIHGEDEDTRLARADEALDRLTAVLDNRRRALDVADDLLRRWRGEIRDHRQQRRS